MRLVELHLKAFGPFTDQVLALGAGDQRLVLVHGMNESGKSSTLRAISALRFGIPTRSPDRFVHDYAQMRVGGVFVDAQGAHYTLMRRKGSGATLKFADLANGGTELPDPVPPAISALLTGGLTVGDYETMFSLDHGTLRDGGKALARGEGEIGAALFQASSGVIDLARILDELDGTARKHFMPAAQARNGRINLALTEYKAQSTHHRDAIVKPGKWEAASRASEDARDALTAHQLTYDKLRAEQLQINELIAVAPVLATLDHASAVVEAMADVALLAEDAPAERAAALAGSSDALADARTHETAAVEHRGIIDAIELDPAIIAIGVSVTRLHAMAPTLAQLHERIAGAEADIGRCDEVLADRAAAIDPTGSVDALIRRSPAGPARARIDECIAALDNAERALAQHRLSRPAEVTRGSADQSIPDAAFQAAVRVALEEVTRGEETLGKLARLPGEIASAERAANTLLAAAGLSDEAAARRVRPLLGAVIDEATQRLTDLGSQRRGIAQRIVDMETALARQHEEIAGLLAHGPVPTHDEVRMARARRQDGWAFIRAEYIERTRPDYASFAQGRPLADAYEQAVQGADAIVDELARDTGRATRLEEARRQLASLERDLDLRRQEIRRIDADREAHDARWRQALERAAIPVMPPGQLGDWQALCARVNDASDALQARRDELARAQALENTLAGQLRGAVLRLGVTRVSDDTPLSTLVAVATDDLKQISALVSARTKAAGQAEEFGNQVRQHVARDAELDAKADLARQDFSAQMPALLLGDDATIAQAKARLGEFDALAEAMAALTAARARRNADTQTLAVHRSNAESIAATLAETVSEDITTSAERWAARLAHAQQQQARRALAEQTLDSARSALEADRAKAARHEATLQRLSAAARVASATDLPEAEERSRRKLQALRDIASASAQLAKASRRDIDALHALLAGRDHEVMLAEASRIDRDLGVARERLDSARAAEEAARRALDSIDASDEAAAAADAMARAAATVRNTLPLQIRTRLAHALLQESVRRFKDRSQAPMLRSASGYFAQITGGEFESLINDDSNATPVIAAKRAGGELVGVDAMSEGTRDQLYLALRLAALELQRERGVDLPVILDDVLMASDDARAGCIFKALAAFSAGGQVIVFTHHRHLCEVARQSVAGDGLAIVEMKRA